MTTIHLHTRHNAGPVDPRIFGGFLEHLGRAVYGGVFDPANRRSDSDGFRQDVLEAIRPMRMPVVRYPGGNFVSAYDWLDGVGPKDKRPRRREVAWKSIETNQFGTDEFAKWCRAAGAEPMLAVNLGTGTPDAAAALVEYCNLPGGTQWADLRIANGQKEPWGVKLWCLGNEMDGPWQAGHVPADVYARNANIAAALMKRVDPSIQTVACGSSGRWMGTYLEWDRTVLETCWDRIDYISAHRYSANRENDTPWFLAEGVEIDRVLADYAGLIDYVRGRRRSDKQVFVSFDEWNVWYRQTSEDGKWQEAPRLLEEVYNFEDALVCAQYLSAFIRRADLVKVACLAQIVNVIAPIVTSPDGLLLQTIYHPFVLWARHAAGISLRPALEGPSYRAGGRGEVPRVDAAATYNPEAGTLAVFLVNRSQESPASVEVRLADATVRAVRECRVMGDVDVKATNTWEAPDAVRPREGKAVVQNGVLKIDIPAPGLAVVAAEVS